MEGLLDVAWRRVEALLPDGWQMSVGPTRDRRGYWAQASTWDEERRIPVVLAVEHQPTPAVALNALAARLEELRAGLRP